MFFVSVFAAVYLKLQPWQFGISAFILSGIAIFVAFRIDRREKTK